MRKIYLAVMLCLLVAANAVGQTAKVTVHIASAGPYKGYVGINDPIAKFDPAENGSKGIALNSEQSGYQLIDVNVPHTVSLSLFYSTGKGQYADKSLYYNLFLTPGDDIQIKLDLTKKDGGIVVTGRGSNNSQPAIQKLTDIYDDALYRNDKMPNKAVKDFIRQQSLDVQILNNYITRYKPSQAFIAASKQNIAYYAAAKFFMLKTRNLDPSRHHGPWQKAQDSLFMNIPVQGNTFSGSRTPISKLNNDAALISYNYQQLLGSFLVREKERLWDESRTNPQAFYKEWYHTNVAKGKKLIDVEAKSLLMERIINKDFSGKTAEYMYAYLLQSNYYQSYYQNIDVLFDHFKQRYPHSSYIKWFEQPIAAIVKKQQQQLNDKMVFVANNGTKLNTLKDVIALNKGKAVFIDMWGTWCTACRADIEKDSEALRAHFKGKNVVFVYVANHDQKREQEWKKLIAYYHMEGMHILANERLTNSIMNSIKATGFPSYLIIKKDGTYKGAKSQYPLDLQITESELQAAL